MSKKENDDGPIKDQDLIPIPKGPISEELAEELADEAERGYADIDKWRVEYVGRPSLSGNGTSPKMSFRITPELYLALEQKAAKDDMTVSQATREAIALYVSS
jgi:hypothetical protein